jgi:hypothetical protein
MSTLKELQELAIGAAGDETVGANVLIDTALQALLDGVESPSLPLLAGLSRREEAEAQELFRVVSEELGIAPPLPAETPDERWRLVRWLCEAIANEKAAPDNAGFLIWSQGWKQLGQPERLRPLIGWLSEWDDPPRGVERHQLSTLIREEARRLSEGSWPG